MDAELEPRRDLVKRRLGAFAAGEAIGDNADMVAAVGLAVGKIEDVPEDIPPTGARTACRIRSG